MKIVYDTWYLDGGTRSYKTDTGIEYCKDKRMTSNKSRLGFPTVGRWFFGYPNNDNSNIIEDTNLIVEIEDALNIYESEKHESNKTTISQ